MNLFLSHCSSTYPLLHSSTVSLCFYRAPQTYTPTLRTSATVAVAARDRVIDFGKHKGKMLGTLPSNYLKWVSKNLRARDFEEWANLADQVLADPVYRDRIEWELAEKVLNGDVLSRSHRDQNAVSELLQMSEGFGWNNEDKVGWSEIDFGLLGTSKGGRIPRVSETSGGAETESRLKREKVRGCNDGERRRERRDRIRLKKRSTTTMSMSVSMGIDDDDDEVRVERKQEIKQDRTAENHSPFPGREALLKKVLNRRRL